MMKCRKDGEKQSGMPSMKADLFDDVIGLMSDDELIELMQMITEEVQLRLMYPDTMQ